MSSWNLVRIAGYCYTPFDDDEPLRSGLGLVGWVDWFTQWVDETEREGRVGVSVLDQLIRRREIRSFGRTHG